MKTDFESIAIDSLERVGLIMRPALLKIRSLAAELAGIVNANPNPMRCDRSRPKASMSVSEQNYTM